MDTDEEPPSSDDERPTQTVLSVTGHKTEEAAPAAGRGTPSSLSEEEEEAKASTTWKPQPLRDYSDEEEEEDEAAPEGEYGVVSERRGGDGGEEEEQEQEGQPSRKVDDDQDKKNPQYIPKRGTFYEHDDRTADDGENAETAEAEKEKEPKKKVWQDKKERWGHDKFEDSEQAPKSKSEIIATYGYDIRNEDGPPRARRRRRYGRGPNKYTRNWEDEDAYSKPPQPVRPKKPPLRKPTRNEEEFPPLGGRNANSTPDDRDRDQNRPERVAEKEDNRQYIERRDQRHQPETNGNVRAPSSSGPASQAPGFSPSSQDSQPQQNRPQPPASQRAGSGRVPKPKREIKEDDYRGFTTKTRQDLRKYMALSAQGGNPKGPPQNQQKSGGGGGPQKTGPQKRGDFIQSQNFTNTNSGGLVQDVEHQMAGLSVQDGGDAGDRQNKMAMEANQRQQSVPPRLQHQQQSEQKGSKRYSEMRQRSLPEAGTPPFGQHRSYYPNDYAQQPQVPQQGAILHQAAQLPQVPQIGPPPLGPMGLQVPVSADAILQAPPQFAASFPQPPPQFLQPGVPPPPYLPPQTPHVINYVASQPQFPPQGYQGFQNQYSPVTQPELYQPQTGITYYSADQQVIAQRAAPQKRPKAAIPIVAPPPLDLNNRQGDSPPPLEPEMRYEQEAGENVDGDPHGES